MQVDKTQINIWYRVVSTETLSHQAIAMTSALVRTTSPHSITGSRVVTRTGVCNGLSVKLNDTRSISQRMPSQVSNGQELVGASPSQHSRIEHMILSSRISYDRKRIEQFQFFLDFSSKV